LDQCFGWRHLPIAIAGAKFGVGQRIKRYGHGWQGAVISNGALSLFCHKPNLEALPPLFSPPAAPAAAAAAVSLR